MNLIIVKKLMNLMNTIQLIKLTKLTRQIRISLINYFWSI